MKPMGPNLVLPPIVERKVRSNTFEHNPEYTKNINTHKWVGTFVRNRISGGGCMQWSHCSFCNISYEMFKFNPLSCEQCSVIDILT